MKPLAALLLLLILPLVALADSAGHETGAPEAWLERMREAVVNLNYEGTFVYQKGDDLETMHIIHGRIKGRPMSRVTALSGERRQVLRSGEALTCIWPDKRKMLREPVRDKDELPLPVPAEPGRLLPHYRFEDGGMNRVAGFSCRVIRIRPRDDYRYGYEYCIEPETGMLLKAAILDPQGQLMEQFLFTRISFPEMIPASAFSEEGYRDFRIVQLPEASKSNINIPITFKGLPPGFKVISQIEQPASGDQPAVHQVILGDGLATVSVFAAPVAGARLKPWEGSMRSGAVQALADERDGWQLTVVGEVPMRTLQQLLSSVVVPQS
ncbi:MAG: transcriptional regulator [Gammaproteobacteria bacterium]|nr:MAG: transcriptional regulator [Gammaproteobacteria bacterium]